ncbi:RagB/SusD family nutrient uptake outer membrane protein [Pedobacter punctiformis]|uniref:RagB/SusD family nutrient uptake outer membrane protein n=1 Tax=Pedobacter punctiformis TaxID=3004097 RepID=A0ABT4LAA5_9SPHI|nr:RagB/SusD family nutrient uptake outer membrane protein [Pedobacter sp. HCMS5-2]MCZ4244860.1 RagB/SusD family nutrient uptake outer membrane protein [Pedobacter sp. HCMS5-2]
MKQFKYIFLIVGLSISTISCKKFLNIVPTDNLSGNNFWQTRKDVEGFTNGLYRILRTKTAQSGGFFPVADIRCTPLNSVTGNLFISQLSTNNLRGLVASNQQWTSGYNFQNMTYWVSFYDIIQGANILYAQVDKVPDPSLSETDKKRYKAEAVFMRNLAYFFIVRLYGDVPYYTNAYNEEPLPRTPMLTVLNNCIADMNAVKADLPWTYSDPSLVGVRAMRGGAIALLMHMNMWAAGFDEVNKTKYYTEVKNLGAEITSTNDYSLLPLTEDSNKQLFKGRTKESLFEILQNANYGEKFSTQASFWNLVSHYPLKGAITNTNSLAYYDKKFMDQIYSDGLPDLRKDIWFENRSASNGTFQFKKFANVYVSGTEVLNDDDIIVFRLSDALLLTAEAEAELGEEAEAKRYVNMVRQRAKATDITSSGNDLKDDIYFERVRELMGEGHYYYDLVRTKKILDSKYCYRVMTVSDYNARAWTWPIDPSALLNNPNMTLNNFWR